MMLNGGAFEGKRFLSAELVRLITTKETGEAVTNHTDWYGMSATATLSTRTGRAFDP